ncbi:MULTISPECIES: hypothetical protein [unclassified Bradyrhizobium]|uniref:hypothetical protein n=1 Tax=unclassified Bradyrhizobium TaxID=2631580 RepID=UPI0029162520|nr:MULTISPECIES: hypothetical protein [unclassified Bradyrhizobium]
MDNAGVYTLAAMQIGDPKPTALVAMSPMPDLSGMSAVSLEASLQYGSGGTSLTAIVVTSFDNGLTWRHIARFDFGAAAATRLANIQASGAKGVADYADLGAQGVNDGILGDRLALILSSTGTYSNTTLSVRAAVR